MYQLRPPNPALRPFVEHYWFVGDVVDLRVDVFVDGRADLIFNFGAPYMRSVIGGPVVEQTGAVLEAQRLAPIRITQRGEVSTCGVRFRLGGLGPFTRAPLRAFTGSTPPAVDVFGPRALDLEAGLRADPDPDAQARRLDAYFLDALDLSSPFPVFEAGLRKLSAASGPRVDEVAREIGVSTRQLDRLFVRYLGIAPKPVAGILRFQRALRALMRDPGVALAEVGAEAGYFDQSHFIREFKRMSGGVPRGYRGYFPPAGPSDFAPNVVAFVQDRPRRAP